MSTKKTTAIESLEKTAQTAVKTITDSLSLQDFVSTKALSSKRLQNEHGARHKKLSIAQKYTDRAFSAAKRYEVRAYSADRTKELLAAAQDATTKARISIDKAAIGIGVTARLAVQPFIDVMNDVKLGWKTVKTAHAVRTTK